MTAARDATGDEHPLALAPEDYDIPKHRWSAFFGTHLELSLRSRGIDTLLLVGWEFFLDKVFPRMCRVRTTDQVVAALSGGAQ